MYSSSRKKTTPPRKKAAPQRNVSPAVSTVKTQNSASVEIERLSKVMAARGLCSRREADQLIEQGLVRVDGITVSQLGVKVSPHVRIELTAQAQQQQAQQRTILLHKPVGFVSGQPEPGYKAAVSLIRPENEFISRRRQNQSLPQPSRHGPVAKSKLLGLAPAGRLDIDSTGLLVLTQNGRIARQLIGASSTVDKEYIVRISGHLSDEGLRRLNHGLMLDGVALRPARVEWLAADVLRFVLCEGRKRQIRRMCELVGVRVTSLKRVRIGRVVLADLPMGQWRYLRADEHF